MKCPKCQYDNPDTSRFCGNCATSLTPGGPPPPVLTKTLETPAHVLTKGSLIASKYRVIEEIGRGGMGIVYKAEDTKLARKVAIKVLPEVFTADPERLARFEREAKLLALLNHPNIATIFGLEETDGKRFLIMELVEGETLAERISRGPLPLEQALKVCLQVAEGVEAAHEKGIIHRDLKPGNVKLSPEGKATILDFGLAKAFYEGTAASDLSGSPTITEQMTEPGVILGTAAYMSPEQAKGAAIDKRVDIWAFGCILYECLTGKRPFLGNTVTESIAAILRGEPDWDSLPADTPGNVRAVLRRCLQKDPRQRLHDIADARIEIGEPTAFPFEAAPVLRRRSLPWLAAGAVVMLLAGTIIGRLFIWKSRPAPSPSVVSATVKLEPGHWLDGKRSTANVYLQRPHSPAMAISSDGKFVVYCAIEENPGPQAKRRLFLRRLDQSEAKPITGTEGGIHPFLSPDNRWVGFWAEQKLKKVPVEGGVPVDICEAQDIFGANWGRDNVIIFTAYMDRGLSRVSADGGTPEILTTPDPKREEASHRLPFWLPNGKAVLFTVMKHRFDRRPGIALLHLDRRVWKMLLPDAADVRYVPTRHLVFLRQGTLLAVRFDPAKLEVIGQPFPLAQNVSQGFTNYDAFNTGAGQFSISDTGTLIYATGGVVPPLNNTLVWVDQRGVEQPVMQFPALAAWLSPDGRRICYGGQGIWVYDMDRGIASPLTVTDEGTAFGMIWAPDGNRLLIGWQKLLAMNLFWQPSDGSSPIERLTTSEFEQRPSSWSPDGKAVALVETHPDTYYDIAMLDIRSGRVTPFLNSPFNETCPEFSPDGRWVAYSSDESKRYEVYVRPFPGPGMKIQVSSEGGVQPLWARNGRQLFYRWQNQVWVVDVRIDGGLAISKPRLLFEKSGYNVGMPTRSYNLSLDGQRFLMVRLEDRKPSPLTEMALVQNWFEELKRLDPAGKK